MTPVISVVIPTHNPRMDYLARVLDALRQQTLPREQWEIVVVDNYSQPALVGDRSQATGGVWEEGTASASAAANDSGVTQAEDLRLTDLKLKTAELELGWHSNARIVREERLGLTFARLRGFAEAKGDLIVMVDDDNLLGPDYLANAVEIASKHPDIGAFGGKCLPEFEKEPEPWMREFLPLLALRDHGDDEIVSGDILSPDGSRRAYPDRAAPIGAGMALRRDAAAAYAEGLAQRTTGPRDYGTAERLLRSSGLRVAGGGSEEGQGVEADGRRHTAEGRRSEDGIRQVTGDRRQEPVNAGMPSDGKTEPRLGETARGVAEGKNRTTEKPNHRAAVVITDRRGDSLASAGDNDLVFTILRDGWKVGYFPNLVVTHLIPKSRLTPDYLARANRGVQRSWVQVLRKHDACPWPKIPGWSLPLRKAKAWVRQQPWRDASARIRLAGVIGRFEGQVAK